MSIRLTSLGMLALTMSLCALSAHSHAHDPRDFDRMAGPVATKPLPKTCANLDDPYEYRVDLEDPDVKLLKKHCDAAKAKSKTTIKKP